jgi:hypothetical protein
MQPGRPSRRVATGLRAIDRQSRQFGHRPHNGTSRSRAAYREQPLHFDRRPFFRRTKKPASIRRSLRAESFGFAETRQPEVPERSPRDPEHNRRPGHIQERSTRERSTRERRNRCCSNRRDDHHDGRCRSRSEHSTMAHSTAAGRSSSEPHSSSHSTRCRSRDDGRRNGGRQPSPPRGRPGPRPPPDQEPYASCCLSLVKGLLGPVKRGV